MKMKSLMCGIIFCTTFLHCFGQDVSDRSPKVGTLNSVTQDGCGCTFTRVKGDKNTIFVCSEGSVNGSDAAYMLLNGKVEQFTLVKSIQNITIYENENYILTRTAKPSKQTGDEGSEESGTLEIEVRRIPVGQPGKYTTKITYFGECGC